LNENKLEDTETSYRKTLRTTVEPEDVVGVVSSHLGIPVTKLVQMKGGARDIAVYLMKVHTEMTNNEMGEYFGGLSYSAVAKIKQRFSDKLTGDSSLRKRIEKMDREMSNVKG
jgi:chromosomal replication initiation ATPase DnaA